MSPVEVRDLGDPEAVVTGPLGASNQVRLAGTVVTRHVLQPGWSWEEHAQPEVGTASCELFHRGVVLKGRMGIRTDEGEEVVIGPNQVFDLPPGHVTWVEGDEELVMVDWAGGAGFDPQRGGGGARVMATILFTDIVDSTAHARTEGDSAWKRTWPCTKTSSAPCWSTLADGKSRPRGIRFSSCSTAPSARSAADWSSSTPWRLSGSPSASAFTAARWPLR